jgi:hypothetical protein
MKCNYILTGVEVERDEETETKSFFVMQADFLYDYKPYFAKLRFDWQSSDLFYTYLEKNLDQISDLALLVSIDGLDGQLRPIYGDKVDIRSEEENLVPFYERDGFFGVEGGYEKFKMVVEAEFERNPDKSIYYDYLPEPSIWRIPDRFNFSFRLGNFGLEQLDSELHAAINNPEAGSDDAIALLYISRNVPFDFLDYDQDQIDKEVELRLLKKMNFNAHYLNFSELTIEELNQRNLRARWYFEKLKKDFGSNSHDDAHMKKVFRFLRSLEDDVLAELTMLGFYAGVEMKPLLIVISERIRGDYQF